MVSFTDFLGGILFFLALRILGEDRFGSIQVDWVLGKKHHHLLLVEKINGWFT